MADSQDITVMNAIVFALFAFMTIVFVANANTCQLPCLGQKNGCVCDPTKTFKDGYGQTFGLCVNCTSGWRGGDCMTPVLPCTHGAPKINGTCQCPERWTGLDCQQPQCAHAPDQRPSATANDCPMCAEGYDGLMCTMCQGGSKVCGEGMTCNTSLVPNNLTKSYECGLMDPSFIYLLGDGRPNVSGTVVLDCVDPLGGGLMVSPNGTCLMSLIRKETNNIWNDEFFSCQLSGLSVTLIDGDTGKHTSVPTQAPGAASSLRTRREVYIALLMVLGTAVLFNGSVTKSYKKRSLLFCAAGLLIAVVLLVFVIDSTAGMQTFSAASVDDNSKNRKQHISFKFLYSHCVCAPDPPHLFIPALRPFCGDSVFGGLLKNVKGASELYCDVQTGQCTYSHTQILANTPIALQCRASECVSKSTITQPFPQYLAVTKVVLKIWMIIIILIIVLLFGMYLRARFVNRALGDEFHRRFREVDMRNAEVDETFSLGIHDLNYTVTIEDTEQKILDGINVHMKSGCVLAIMGPSGAGKTTLLDVLAAHEKLGNVTGSLRFNGTEITKSNIKKYKSVIAFVAQEDTLLPTLTVYDAVLFVARLSLPSALPLSAKDTVANWAIDQLGLSAVRNSMIGSQDSRGISGGERRRVSIAIALVSNPRILLLDEPTSGLDSYSALQVVKVVSALKHARHPLEEYSSYFNTKPMVIMSIHQPSREVFELLDVLLLMSAGKILYHGPPSVSTFEAYADTKCRPNQNPADYILEVAHDLTPSQRNQLLERHRERSVSAVEIEMNDEASEATTLMSTPPPGTPSVHVYRGSINGDDFERPMGRGKTALDKLAERRKFLPNGFEQCHILLSRSMKHLMGSYHLVTCHTAVTLILSMFLSYMYQGQGLDLPGALNRAGSITFVLLVLAFSSLSSLELFLVEKTLFFTERENGYYTTMPYFVTKVLLDFIPLRLFPTLFLSAIVYFPMGLRVDQGSNYLWFLVTLVLFNFVTAAQCFCVAMVVPSFGAGALVSSLLMLWEFVFGGLMVQAKTIPSLLQPFKLISPFFLAFEALMVNELDGQSCTFAPTDAYGNPTGYSVPLVCSQYLSNLDLEPMYFSRDETLLCFWLVVYLVMAGLLLMFGIRHKR